MVDILLTSFNGEAYIETQILSIIGQSFKQWKLLIHDDGSNDLTIDIIKKYTKIDGRIIFIDDQIKNLGCALNFIHLLDYSDSPFIMFCDQDDFWFENKVEILYNLINKKDNNIANVYYSNAYLWSLNLGILNNRKATIYKPYRLKDILMLNCGIQGSSAIFNAKMRDILKQRISKYSMHDHILTLAGITLGNIFYTDSFLMLYRQHTSNVTGNIDGAFKSKLSKVIKRKNIPVIDKNHYDSACQFYALHKSKFSFEDLKIFQIFFALPKMNLLKIIYFCWSNSFSLYGSKLLLLLKLLTRPVINSNI